nr:IclR family transcriptional regulator [Burkholderia cenocepacia]
MIYSEVIQPDTAGPLPAHSPMRFRLPPARLTLDYGLSPAAPHAVPQPDGPSRVRPSRSIAVSRLIPDHVMSSLTKMLSILDVFSSSATSMTAEEIAEHMGFSRTTCYRYVKELASVGLLVGTNGRYTLGPRIIHLDYNMRQSDPTLTAAKPVIQKLVQVTGGDALVSTLFDEQIINVMHETGAENLQLGFGRGRIMPLFQGASSKVIVAAMSRARLKRLHERHNAELGEFATDWTQFWRACQQIVEAGYWISRGELDAGFVGIAAPIRTASSGEVNSSLSLIFRAEHFALFDEHVLGKLLIDATAQIGDAT